VNQGPSIIIARSAAHTDWVSNEFAGKRALVTGGTQGIGEAIVNRLLRGGASVLTTARSIPAGGSPDLIKVDLSTRAGADHVIRTTLDRWGGWTFS
jgi:NAD(P)-dependent dehydrogenase (short-subunit alcohol dehydrogenase family)